MKRIAALVVAVLPTLASASAAAQTAGRAEELERIAIVNFGPWNGVAGARASESLRRLLDRATRGQYRVISKLDIEHPLTNGTEADGPPEEGDDIGLAKMMRALLLVRGTVRDSAGATRLDAVLLHTGDPALRQPFGPYVAPTVDQAVARLGRDLVRALAQFPGAQECHARFLQNDLAGAIEAARAAEARHPGALLARTCRLRAMAFRKDGGTAVLALAESLLAVDSTSPAGLANASDVNLERGDTARAVALRARLFLVSPWRPRTCVDGIDTPPTRDPLTYAVLNAVLQRDSVGRWPLAVAWDLARCERDWRRAIAFAHRLEATDSSAADSTFFVRLARAYASDSQPQKAAETLARAVARFPASAGLRVHYATALRSAGQRERAVDVLRHVLGADPKASRARLVLAQLHVEMNRPDSALEALHAGRAAGEDSATLGQAALTFGGALFRAAIAQRDAAERRGGLLRALAFAALADSVKPSPTSRFLIHVAAFNVGLGYAQEAQGAVKAQRPAAACAASRSAIAHFETSQLTFRTDGGRGDDGQVMSTIHEYGPVLRGWRERYCR